MQDGEESAEEVVQGHNKGVQVLLAIVQLEGWMLFRILGEGQNCRERVCKLQLCWGGIGSGYKILRNVQHTKPVLPLSPVMQSV